MAKVIGILPHWRQIHYMDNAVIADDLAKQGTKISAAMALI